MNANALTAKFKLLLNYEKEMNYKYEPRFKKEKRTWKRHINFKDFKEDFIADLSTFGFSPFILKTSKEQLKDPDIMRYKPRNFNSGLVNYVKRKQENLDNKNEFLHKQKVQQIGIPKQKQFLSQALKQISQNNANFFFEEEHFKNDDNTKVYKHKEHNRTTATNATDIGRKLSFQRNSLFHKEVSSKSKRMNEIGLTNNLQSVNYKITKKDTSFKTNSNIINYKSPNNKKKKVFIFKNKAIKNKLSQMQLINSLSCCTMLDSTNKYLLNKTRNRDFLSSDNLFTRARILCQINLSS